MTVATPGRVSPNVIEQAVDGSLRATALRRISTDPVRHGLGGLLAECLHPGRAWTLELLRTKYKPSRKLTAYYRIRTVRADADIRHLAVSWLAGQPGDAAPPLQDLAPLAPTGPFARLAAASEDGRIRCLVSPADPAMPQLARLSRPRHVAELVEGLTGQAVGPPDLAELATIRYRPGQRHVLLARFGDRHPCVYVKTDRDHSGAGAVSVAAALADMLARNCPDAHVAEPLGYATEDHAALWRLAAGRPVSSLLVDRTVGRPAVIERAGRALRAVHELTAGSVPPPTRGSLERRGFPAEAASTLRAGEHITALLPSVGRVYAAVVSEAVDRVDRLPAATETFNHGDFKCDNLLAHGDRLRILDLDRSGWGDPAADLGKFMADLRWWCAESETTALIEAFRAGYGPCEPGRWARAALFAALFRVKLAARRCALHDPGWPTAVAAQVSRAQADLGAAVSA